MWTGLIFAGGLGLRMGRDKALVDLGGTTLLRRAVNVVRAAGGEPMVLGPARPAAETDGARQIDETGGKGGPGGPLAALECGLRAVAPSTQVVALACDLPCVTAGFLRQLVRSTPGWDAVVPRAADELQVLAAAYNATCLEAIVRARRRGERGLLGFLKEVRMRILEAEGLVQWGGAALFLNVNTPEDLERARAICLAERR
jgi:molybdopterin-guanine dinucleotide biosynthesis protein A